MNADFRFIRARTAINNAENVNVLRQTWGAADELSKPTIELRVRDEHCVRVVREDVWECPEISAKVLLSVYVKFSN